MALSRALIALTATVILSSTVATATEFIVGDDKGWTTHVDYQAWARDKVFHVGDILVFKFPAGKDNVAIVNVTNFIECTVPPNTPEYDGGLVAFEFLVPGRRYFISGVGDNCKQGQKLAIFVFPASPPPAPAPRNEPPLLPPVVPGPTVSAPWSTDVPAPSPGPSADTWTTGFSNFDRSVPRKQLFRVFH